MPTWEELVGKIETKEQFVRFATSLRSAIEEEEKKIVAIKRSQILADYQLNPQKYLDSKGVPYTKEKMESEKVDKMIADREPAEFFDQDTKTYLEELTGVLTTTGLLKTSINETYDQFKPVKNDKVTAYGKQILKEYIADRFDTVSHPFLVPVLEEQKELLAEPLKEEIPPLNATDVETFMNLMSPAQELGELFEELAPLPEKIVSDIMGKVATNTVISDNGNDPEPKIFNKEYDAECKTFAKDIYDKVESAKNKVVDDPDHPAASSFQMEILNFMQIEADALVNGIHLKDPKFTNQGFRLMSTLGPQLNFNMFKPENAAQLEEALKEYPLDKLAHLCNEMQKRQNEYTKNVLKMSDEEKKSYQSWMESKNAELLELSKDLYEKSLNPGAKTLSLFGSPDMLKNQERGFIGNRGLRSTIDTLNEHFVKPAIPAAHIRKLDDTLNDFFTKRAFFFKNESAAHEAVLDTAELILTNLKKLHQGTYTDKDGKVRPLGLEEKEALINETVDKLNTLSSATDNYIDHATKNGTKTPSTPTGKVRLSAAQDIKALIPEIQETLAREQEKDYKLSKNTFMTVETNKVAKNAERKSLNLKELQKLDAIANPKPERRNSVHIPNKRPQIDGPAKNANVQGGKAK
jgi:hypothetical protein